MNVWEEYEQRKKALKIKCESWDEYDEEIHKLCKELGI